MKSDELKAAEWLIVGYIKSWDWVLLEKTVHESTGKWMNEYSFGPSQESFWRGKAQVRSYIAQNWPKLAQFLDRTTPEKQIKTAEQVLRLKWNGNHPLGAINKDERYELNKTKKDLRVSTTSYNQSRKEFRAASMHNWNVCK